DMAQRSREARDVFNTIYRRNAVKAALAAGKVFKDLTRDQFETVEQYLDAPGVAEFKRVRAGETIVAEGDDAKDFYLIRVGFVKIARMVDGREEVLAKLTANESFGESALLGFESGRRSASVVALDPVELVKIPGEQFQFLCDSLPDVKKALTAKCQAIREANKRSRGVGEVAAVGEFVEQGLYQGQKLLVLDLKTCTRCDECTKACADSHGDGISRLLREGQRFGDFLVATSCRSCHKPYCMDGCPVDAIHRVGTKLEIQIENNCIGCGLCSANCPYGAIQMVPRNQADERRGNIAAVAKKAVNCDLCHDLIPDGADTFCVAACPHDAAFRWDGETLLAEVQARSRGM
ncbi:MAG: cyclic nucleotide-binding domain-containing protein, partial [Gemmataceae bacterium]